MEFTAKAMYMRVSPQKARLVLDLIKGLRVEQALNTLAFTNKRLAPVVHKLLRSAMENANYMNTEKGVEVDVDRLFVKRAIANEGPRMKRIRPAPMGRAYRYQRRMAHMEIAVGGKAQGRQLAVEASRGGSGQEGGAQTGGQEGSRQEGGGKEGCGKEEAAPNGEEVAAADADPQGSNSAGWRREQSAASVRPE